VSKNKRIVIIGARSSVAEQCARLWCKSEGVDFVLVGRDMGRTERVAADLLVRSPTSTTKSIVVDFQDPIAIQDLVESLFQDGGIDLVLIAHGMLPDQLDCQKNLALCQETMVINGLSPALFAEAFANHMEQLNHGTIVVIGSVAGDRGRQSNYVYGSAKGLIVRYAQGLQHRLAGTAVKVVLIKLGPTDTPMTAQFKARGVKLAPVEDVAKMIVNAAEQGRSTTYIPGKWRVIMWVIRHMPSVIFNRIRI